MTKHVVIAAFLCLLAPFTSFASNVDVMLVFSSDSGLSTFQRTVVAGRYQLALNQTYGFLNGDRTVTVHPLLTPTMSYTAANKHGKEAIRWIRDENDELTSPLRLAREALGNGSADLILMATPGFTNSACGTTDPEDGSDTPPLNVGTESSETFAFAAVVLEESDPGCTEGIVIPHEIGHLLYAEHEGDTNENPSRPDPRNHAKQSSSSGIRSVMWDGVTSMGTDLLSGSIANLTSSAANNVAFMSEESFDIVSLYRVDPGQSTCYIEVTRCDVQGAANTLVTGLWPGHTIGNVDFDWRTSGAGSPWKPLYKGNPTCPIFNTPIDISTVRGILTSALGLLTECQILISPDTCDDDPIF